MPPKILKLMEKIRRRTARHIKADYGITDEGRFSGPGILIEGQDAIRGYVEANYMLDDFTRALGPLAGRRAFAAGNTGTRADSDSTAGTGTFSNS